MLLTSILTFSQEVKEVKVVDTKNRFVKCRFYFNEKYMSNADENGIILMPSNCTINDKISIIPVDNDTYAGIEEKLCLRLKKNPIVIYTHLEMKTALQNSNLTSYLDSSNVSFSQEEILNIYAKAALASNEVYNIESFPDSIRKEARINTIIYTANAFDISNGVFEQNNYIVPSDSLIQEIESFQTQNGLQVTKMIDGSTLQHLSNSKSYEVISKDFSEEFVW